MIWCKDTFASTYNDEVIEKNIDDINIVLWNTIEEFCEEFNMKFILIKPWLNCDIICVNRKFMNETLS